MAKKQTRRSISVSRTTYERLKAFCETNHISMSQLVETRVNDFLGTGDIAPANPMPSAPIRPATPAPLVTPMVPRAMTASVPPIKPVEAKPAQHSASSATSSATTSAQPAPMTSAAARFAAEPPLPIIKPRQDTAAPKPVEKRPEQIFTF
jgi:hypothetical protein